MSNVIPFTVELRSPLGKPWKEDNLEFNFHPSGDHTSPFDVSEWPSIRSDLREEVRERVDTNSDEWETRLTSDREQFIVDIGVVWLGEDGTVERWEIDNRKPEDVNW